MKYSILILFVLIVVFLVTGCQKSSETNIDPEFDQIVTEFVTLYGRDLPAIEIMFKEIDVDAKCRLETNPVTGTVIERDIFVDPNEWNQSSRIEKRATIFHELGHCVLRRYNSPTPHPAGGSMTYMAEWYGLPTTADDAEWLKKNQKALDLELFL